MAIAHVQSAGGNFADSTSARTVNFGSTTTSGNLLVVVITTYRIGIPSNTVSDNKGNTYSLAVSKDDGSNRYVAIYYCANASGGASHTVTVTPISTSYVSFSIHEYSGAATASVLDSTASATASSTSPATGSIACNQSDTLVIAGITYGGSTTTITPDGTYTERYEYETSANQPISAIEKPGNSTSQDATWTLGASRTWLAAGASFKSATSSPVGRLTRSTLLRGGILAGRLT